MGVQHFEIQLVPRKWFGAQCRGLLPEEEIALGMDPVSGWWAACPPPDRLLSAVRNLLPLARPWPGGEVEEYVSPKPWGSSIRIWKDSGRVQWVAFRFSPAVDDWLLMERFLAAARESQCLLLEERTGRVFEPDANLVLGHMNGSRAMQFVLNPEMVVMEAALENRDQGQRP